MRLAAVIPAFIGLVVFWWLFHGFAFEWDVAAQTEVLVNDRAAFAGAIVGGIASLPFFLIARHMYGKGRGNFHVDVRSIVCVFVYGSGAIFAIMALFIFGDGPSWAYRLASVAVALVVFSPFWIVGRIIWKARSTYL